MQKGREILKGEKKNLSPLCQVSQLDKMVVTFRSLLKAKAVDAAKIAIKC